MDIRDKARAHLLQVPLPPLQINSNGVTAALFTKLSGITQNMLEVSWGKAPRPGTDPPVFRADPPPGLTSCNSFVATYGVAIGIGKPNRSLGQFGLDKKLEKWGKEFAWIKPTPGARPKFGDIFELAKRLHQGIALDFSGDVWNTAEGGQGGSTSGFDIIKRKTSNQNGDVLTHKGEEIKGWVDIELFANGPAPKPTSVPTAMLGWWSVPWRGKIFYYFFEADFKASWTYTKPISNAFLPFKFDDTATVTVDGPDAITLKWTATGSVEKFKQQGSSQMLGAWNATEPLVATRMFGPAIA